MSHTAQFKSLSHYPVADGGCYVIDSHPANHVHAKSPALAVMTDLSARHCATISPKASLEEANRVLINRGVRMLIVTESADGVAVGLITSTDLLGEKPVLVAHDTNVHVKDLSVSDIMVSSRDMEVLHYEDVQRACVGDIVATLKSVGRGHCLVVRPKNDREGSQELIGIFSATQIARQLGIHIHTHEIAKTFSEIEAALA